MSIKKQEEIIRKILNEDPLNNELMEFYNALTLKVDKFK